MWSLMLPQCTQVGPQKRPKTVTGPPRCYNGIGGFSHTHRAGRQTGQPVTARYLHLLALGSFGQLVNELD